ncbi:phosphate ABC transporter substrate-binding protein [Rugamonas apoptosis]|uniref:Phosphate ABC transporter substrate-binding protein n=1 Tax=Rugamonas apoptosis TaxID=2758570 RepID=A0A7W2IMR6_9BURK|nr:phosphate ABC transporter substrate-binding protein [Rugamonas apoptosis]MBA5689914.1 phosphate ABC transporter substrate-binding protein [Rugamonas apoptosis]
MRIRYQSGRALLAVALALATQAASAEVVVIVSAKNACGTLSTAQVGDIFLGNSASFPAGATAVPVDQSDGSPVREEFYGKVLGKSAAQVKAHWSKLIFTGKGRPPKEAGDSAAVRKLVADSGSAIGYVERAAVDASVKVVFSLH